MFNHPADQPFHLLPTVIKPGNDEGNCLDMHAEFPCKCSGIKHRLQTGTADFFVKIVVECLDIYPECPEHGGKFTQCLLRDVPVCHVNSSETFFPGKHSHIECILMPYGWFIVGPCNTCTPAGKGPLNSFFRREVTQV